MPRCLEEIHAIYQRLGILPFDFEHGESFYNPMLAGRRRRHAGEGDRGRESGRDGHPECEGDHPETDEEQKKEEPPAIIRKRDGAFTYTTTDLATIQVPGGTLGTRTRCSTSSTSARRCTSRPCSPRPAAGATIGRRVAAHSVRLGAGRGRQAVRDAQGRRARTGERCSTRRSDSAWRSTRQSYAEREASGHDVSET